jgi:hypothetical protein
MPPGCLCSGVSVTLLTGTVRPGKGRVGRGQPTERCVWGGVRFEAHAVKDACDLEYLVTLVTDMARPFKGEGGGVNATWPGAVHAMASPGGVHQRCDGVSAAFMDVSVGRGPDSAREVKTLGVGTHSACS